MMGKIDKYVLWFVGLTLSVPFVVLLFVLLGPDPDEKRRTRNESAGRDAFEAGVPANANPYQGSAYATSSAQWLNGWVAASKEKGK